MKIKFLHVALAGAAIFCAEVSWAQRSSTLDNGTLFVDIGDAYIDTIRTASAEQCRAACLALGQCQAWVWSGVKWGNGCARYKTSKLNREADPYFVSGVVSAAGAASPSQLFPLPRTPMTIMFRVPSAADPNAERYASFKFTLSEGDSTNVLRRAWEGPADAAGGAEQYVPYTFDEVLGVAGSINCTISASPQQLRQVQVGSKLSYTRTCFSNFNDGNSSTSVATVTRMVERNEKVTVPAGTFDAVAVKKLTRTTHKSIRPDGSEAMTEISESENSRWWAPALGFYVKDQARSRIVDRNFSQRMIDEYRREGEPLPPRSTDWHGSPAMIAIIVR